MGIPTYSEGSFKIDGCVAQTSDWNVKGSQKSKVRINKKKKSPAQVILLVISDLGNEEFKFCINQPALK